MVDKNQLAAGGIVVGAIIGLGYYIRTRPDWLERFRQGFSQTTPPPITPTPEIVAEKTSSFGVKCNIRYHPDLNKYSVICPGAQVFSKGPEFRSQNDAEWYITKVMHGGKERSEQEKAEDNWNQADIRKPNYPGFWKAPPSTYKAGSGKKYHVYTNYAIPFGRTGRFLVRDPLGKEQDKFFENWKQYQDYLKTK